MAKYTEAQNKSTQKYIKKAYDDIKVRVPKGKREIYKAHAESQGKSLNQLVIELLDKDINKCDILDKILEYVAETDMSDMDYRFIEEKVKEL